jgi:Ger(x)C family germination protein
VFFFSSDFGLIDVEKTSIITGIAIDKQDGEYTVTAQIAVPEATDTNSENLKAQLQGKSSTIGGALKDIGDLSGWFPKLAFCNLIIIGKEVAEDNVIKVLDYFAKTLRVQDSALVVLAENKGYDILSLTTPLDNISSFALQKILLKNTGFDRDIRSTDVKTFCSGHYSISNSALMPIISPIKAGSEKNKEGSESSSSGGSHSQNSNNESEKCLFNAKTTALFKGGKKVGELDEPLTMALNSLSYPFKGTTFSVDGVKFNGENTNYLLTVLNSSPSLKVFADDKGVKVNINLQLYCKISDHSADGSDEALSQNHPIPRIICERAQEYFKKNIEDLIMTEKQTGCDLLKIKEKLYRFNFPQYSKYKDNYLDFDYDVNVEVSGQK